jgi:hypothetical protein
MLIALTHATWALHRLKHRPETHNVVLLVLPAVPEARRDLLVGEGRVRVGVSAYAERAASVLGRDRQRGARRAHDALVVRVETP